MSDNSKVYDGGLSVPNELWDILAQPGHISVKMGGQRARLIYSDGSVAFDPHRLSPFGLHCYLGALEEVQKDIEANNAPPLSSRETAYKWGYATLILSGAQRIIPAPGNAHMYRHLETLKYLIQRGVPLEVEDIAGWTALSHAAMAPRPQTDIAKALLEAGANPNHQGRYGDVPLFSAFSQNNSEETDLLLEFGASLDIPEANGYTPRDHCLIHGPKIAAVVSKHIQKRDGGQEAPRTEKRCNNCRRTDLSLKNCAKCRVAQYCSVECQRAAWPQHKTTCQPFGISNTLVFKPRYEKHGHVVNVAALQQQALGLNSDPVSTKKSRGAHVPKGVEALGESKNLMIKVQVPYMGNGPLFVYTKKRDLVCTLTHSDQPSNYDQLTKIIKEKGVGGLKSYFVAELKSKHELVIKVSEILAAQPF